VIPLKPAQRVHLSQAVFEQLLAQIRDGSLRPGDRLPGEYELMRQVGVGRSSVREAIRGLIALGLVETKPGRGAVVLEASADSAASSPIGGKGGAALKQWALLDMLEVRESLEGTAAQLAAERVSEARLNAIARASRAVEAQASRAANYFRANLEFHLAIARASQNELLVESLRHLLREVRLYRERMVRQAIQAAPGGAGDREAVLEAMRQRNPATVAEHAAILAAIRRRDPEGARQAMVEHIHHSVRLAREERDLSRG